jgi:hypothetical protein
MLEWNYLRRITSRNHRAIRSRRPCHSKRVVNHVTSPCYRSIADIKRSGDLNDSIISCAVCYVWRYRDSEGDGLAEFVECVGV